MNKNATAALIFAGGATTMAAVHLSRGDLWQAYWAGMSAWFAFNYAREVLKCS